MSSGHNLQCIRWIGSVNMPSVTKYRQAGCTVVLMWVLSTTQVSVSASRGPGTHLQYVPNMDISGKARETVVRLRPEESHPTKVPVS